MIKFFRHIRQRLLNEGRTTKYLTYALGEIVLVVIGILIALQINNWNESRKLRAKRIDLVNALIMDVDLKMKENVSDLLIGKRIIERSQQTMADVSNGRLVDTAEVKQVLEQLGSDEWFYVTNTPTYNSIVNSDLWQQLPDTLARMIQSIYVGRAKSLETGFEKHNEYATDCKLNYLAPSGLLDRNQDPEILAMKISNDTSAFLMYMEINLNGVNRMVRLNKSSSDRIKEVLPELRKYRDELAKHTK